MKKHLTRVIAWALTLMMVLTSLSAEGLFGKTASADGTTYDYTFDVSDVQFPYAGETVDLSGVTVSDSDVTVLGVCIYMDEDSRVGAYFGSDGFISFMENIMSVETGGLEAVLEEYQDAKEYSIEAFFVYNGSLNLTEDSKVGIAVTDTAGETITKRAEVIPGSLLRMSVPSGYTLPDELQNAKTVFTVELGTRIGSVKGDHIHDDDVKKSDASGHWNACSTCGVQIGEEHTHDDSATYYWGGAFKWNYEKETSDSEGAYYTVCSSCGYRTREFIVPKSGEITVVTTYDELKDALAKGGKQYIRCDFSETRYPTMNYIYVENSANNSLIVDDPDADIVLDMNGYGISRITTRDSYFLSVKQGKLSVINKAVVDDRGDFCFWFESANASAGIYVAKDAELYLNNVSMNVIKSSFHEEPDIISYGRLTIDGGFFMSSRNTGSYDVYDTDAAVIIYGGDAVFNAGNVSGSGKGIYVGSRTADSDVQSPTLTVNDGTIYATDTAITVGKNATLTVNGGYIGVNPDGRDTFAAHGILVRTAAANTILNDGYVKGRDYGIKIEDDGNFVMKGGTVVGGNDTTAGTGLAVPESSHSAGITISDGYIHAKKCIKGPTSPIVGDMVVYLKDYIAENSYLEVDNNYSYDRTLAAHVHGTKSIRVTGSAIQGEISYTCGFSYGSTASLYVSGKAANAPAANRHYQWQYFDEDADMWRDISGADYAAYTFSDASLVGKKVRVKLTEDIYTGSLVSKEVVVAKKSNKYTTPAKISYTANPSANTVTINNFDSDTYQYIKLTADKTTANLTESDWGNSANAITSKTFAVTSGSTVYVYARYKETDTATAGNIVVKEQIVNSATVYCSHVTLGDYGYSGTIYIPLGESVTLPISYAPSNCNKGYNYSFSIAYSKTAGLGFTGAVVSKMTQNSGAIPIATAGNVVLTGKTVGSTTLKASYTTNVENQYGSWTVVVYDPDSIEPYAVSTDTGYEDITLSVGDSYTPEQPNLLPKVDGLANLTTGVYMTISNPYGAPTVIYENDYLSIDKTTGKITALKATDTPVLVYVSVKKTETADSTYDFLASFKVSVTEEATIDVEELSLSTTAMHMKVGETKTVDCRISPVNATNQSVSAFSSNSSVVSVYPENVLCALAEGTADITYKCGGKSAVCHVTVSESEAVPVTGISLLETEAKLAADTGMHLNAMLLPENSTGTAITWSSDNEKVAEVDENGYVIANRYGNATITATTAEGFTAACLIHGLFSDVAGTNDKTDTENYQYYYDPVYWAADKGITTGYDGVTFGVGENCTRSALIVFIWRFMGSPAPKGDARKYFTDIPAEKTTATAYNKAIAWAYENGVSKGYSDGTFGYDKEIVRKDAMIMLYRLAGRPAVSGSISFTDCGGYKPGTDTYNAILWGSQKKITGGYSDGTFRPLDNCLREQIITFLYRYDKLK